MKLLYGIIFLSFLCSCAVTDKRQDGHYKNSDDAAAAAFDRFLYSSIERDMEYGGIVYRDDEGYFYTFTMGLAGSGMLSFTPQKFSADVVGTWHTHGDSESGFSDIDIDLSKRSCIPMYVMNKSRRMFTMNPCNYLAKN